MKIRKKSEVGGSGQGDWIGMGSGRVVGRVMSDMNEKLKN